MDIFSECWFCDAIVFVSIELYFKIRTLIQVRNVFAVNQCYDLCESRCMKNMCILAIGRTSSIFAGSLGHTNIWRVMFLQIENLLLLHLVLTVGTQIKTRYQRGATTIILVLAPDKNLFRSQQVFAEFNVHSYNASENLLIAPYAAKRIYTLMLVYHCHKPVFTPKMAIFWRVGILGRKGCHSHQLFNI